MTEVRVVAAGDAALVAEFDDRIDSAINARAIALAQALRRARPNGIRDIVPAYRSVTVYFDPLRTDATVPRVRRCVRRRLPEPMRTHRPVRSCTCPCVTTRTSGRTSRG